jgi:hypothetical protein
MDFDPGPSAAFGALFDAVPDPGADRDAFWFDWGPVFYRGRLDGSARLLCIASDPGPTERVAGRTLVGDAGQRVQGFLTKLGLNRSYLCLNAFPYAMHPSRSSSAPRILSEPANLSWRNQLYDLAKGPGIQAVVAFGVNARTAVDLWPGVGATHVERIPHPSSHDLQVLLDGWRAAVVTLRGIVTPDPGGDPTVPNYGSTFTEDDYAPVPKADLPFGVPPWFGDDRWGREGTPQHHDSVSRPSPDDAHTLTWIAPNTTATP